MIKVKLGDNLSRKEIIIDESVTLRHALEQGNIDYTRGMLHLDGAALVYGDLDKSFSEFNIKEHCYLLSVVKADNGIV